MFIKHSNGQKYLLTSFTTTNATFLTPGPVTTGQVVAPSQISQNETTFIEKFTATDTGAGTNISGVVNYIDGTNGIGFTPSAVMVVRTGGTDTAGAYPVTVADNGGPIIKAGIAAAGSGYAIADTGVITGGNSDATYTVTSILPTVIGGTTGGVANFTFVAGTKYASGKATATTTSTGSGTGLTLNIVASSTSATLTLNTSLSAAGTFKGVLIALP